MYYWIFFFLCLNVIFLSSWINNYLLEAKKNYIMIQASITQTRRRERINAILYIIEHSANFKNKCKGVMNRERTKVRNINPTSFYFFSGYFWRKCILMHTSPLHRYHQIIYQHFSVKWHCLEILPWTIKLSIGLLFWVNMYFERCK